MAITSVQLDRELLNKIKEIMKKKKPLRKINTYAEATREVLIDFINKNKRYLAKMTNQHQVKTITEGSS